MTRITAVALASSDVERLSRFYRQTFGFEVCPAPHGAQGGLDEGQAPQLMLRLGLQHIAIVPAGKGPVYCTAVANSPAFQHFAIVTGDMDAAYRHLETVTDWAPISRAGPEHLPERSGGVLAYKFRDPDGHPLELLQFAGKTVPDYWRGQAEHAPLFWGIDHTAIAVRDTQRSVAFYRQYGFEPDARSLNHGIQQDRLDDVDSAHVEVTALTCAGAPPHLELLCYRNMLPMQGSVDEGVAATRTLLADVPTGQASGVTEDRDGHRLLIS
ncbi:VOC family protein [Devosia sp.]|uniref:VOC family protein n=1 Tax=Devosia sp. TaxID=1871048 RepID=UPI003A937A6B